MRRLKVEPTYNPLTNPEALPGRTSFYLCQFDKVNDKVREKRGVEPLPARHAVL